MMSMRRNLKDGNTAHVNEGLDAWKTGLLESNRYLQSKCVRDDQIKLYHVS